MARENSKKSRLADALRANLRRRKAQARASQSNEAVHSLSAFAGESTDDHSEKENANDVKV